MNPLAACNIRTRAEVWVCPKCGRQLAKGMDGSSYIDPGLACPGWTTQARYAPPAPGGKVFPRGTVVQYRSVGRAVVEQHTCPETYPCWREAADPMHQYALKFETGRYRGTTRNCWVRTSERITH